MMVMGGEYKNLASAHSFGDVRACFGMGRQARFKAGCLGLRSEVPMLIMVKGLPNWGM